MNPIARPAEIKALSGARALPALMIVLYHFGDAHRYVPFQAILGAPAAKGYLWVEFFFALSGFILVHVYSGGTFRYGEFLKARLARIYPLHLFTLLSLLFLMVVLEALAPQMGFVSIFDGKHPPMNTLSSFIANLFLVQAWNMVPGLSWNTVAWFVSALFFLYLVFPVYLWLAKGPAWRGLALIAAGAAWLVLLAWNSHVGLDITFENGVFRGMAGFAIGTGMAVIFRTRKDGPVGRAPEWAHSAAQAVLLLAIGWVLYASGAPKTRADLWTAAALDALILVLAFDRGFLARLLSTAPMQKLGEWSFGIYMGQTFWMQIDRQINQSFLYRINHTYVFGTRLGAQLWIIEPVAVLLVCILWGALLTKFVEQPANAFFKNMLAQRKALRTA